MSKNLLERALHVEAELWRYHGYMYSEESNAVFDDENDGLLYHLEGLAETIQLMQEDDDLEGWERQVADEEECLRQVIAYYKAVVTTPRPRYIYG